MTTETQRPLPVPTEESKPFWEACRRHELILQRCDSCGGLQFYPRAICSSCLSEGLSWQKASGHGTVYSYTIVHRPPTPAFSADVPYVIGLIDLTEGVRMMSWIVECAPDDVFVGQQVEVTFLEASPEITLPMFRPRRPARA